MGQVAWMVGGKMCTGLWMEILTERFHLQGLGVVEIHNEYLSNMMKGFGMD